MFPNLQMICIKKIRSFRYVMKHLLSTKWRLYDIFVSGCIDILKNTYFIFLAVDYIDIEKWVIIPLCYKVENGQSR